MLHMSIIAKEAHSAVIGTLVLTLETTKGEEAGKRAKKKKRKLLRIF